MTHAPLSDLLKQGILAKKAGDKSTARVLFSRVLQSDPNNENGWLWLASVAETPQEAAAMVERVLKINPTNEKALRLRRKLNPQPKPAAQQPQPVPTPPVAKQQPPPPPPPSPKPAPVKKPTRGRILIVDDSQTIRRLVSMTLERRGFEVMQASDGMDALGKISQHVPDLILLDVNMPRMDGYQVTRAVRGSKETSHIPIVMLSGKDGFFDRVKGRIAGATEYITKPFAPRDLITAVEKRVLKKA